MKKGVKIGIIAGTLLLLGVGVFAFTKKGKQMFSKKGSASDLPEVDGEANKLGTFDTKAALNGGVELTGQGEVAKEGISEVAGNQADFSSANIKLGNVSYGASGKFDKIVTDVAQKSAAKSGNTKPFARKFKRW